MSVTTPPLLTLEMVMSAPTPLLAKTSSTTVRTSPPLPVPLPWTVTVTGSIAGQPKGWDGTVLETVYWVWPTSAAAPGPTNSSPAAAAVASVMRTPPIRRPRRKPQPPPPSQTSVAILLSPGGRMAVRVSAQLAAVPRQALTFVTRALFTQTWIESSLAVQTSTSSPTPVVFRTYVVAMPRTLSPGRGGGGPG